VLFVAIHPIENVVPERGRRIEERHVQTPEKEPETPTQISLRQEKAGLAQYRPGRPEGPVSQAFEVALGPVGEVVTVVDQRY